jgi:hypothetical protein
MSGCNCCGCDGEVEFNLNHEGQIKMLFGFLIKILRTTWHLKNRPSPLLTQKISTDNRQNLWKCYTRPISSHTGLIYKHDQTSHRLCIWHLEFPDSVSIFKIIFHILDFNFMRQVLIWKAIGAHIRSELVLGDAEISVPKLTNLGTPIFLPTKFEFFGQTFLQKFEWHTI